MRVISIYPYWRNIGGAANIAILLAENLNSDTPIILTNTEVHPKYKNRNVKFQNFALSTLLALKDDDILISHHRKSTTILMLYKIIFFWKKINIIHVAHSTYDTFKYLTIFPKKIVAVSNAVSKNHMSFFGLSSNRVSVVFNGLKDQTSGKSIFPRESDGTIRILLPASICPVKQQTILAQALKGKLKSNVHIYFAGIGPDLHALQEIIANDSNMHTLGLINMYESLPDYDYIMLFSKKEGLPTVFLEGCMYGKPIITNNIPPIHDIVTDKYNGYIYNSMDNLIDGLSNLPLSSDKEYLKLSNNARKVYLEKFTVDKMIDGYIKVIYCD